MKADFLKALEAMAVKAGGPVTVPIPGTSSRLLVRQANGDYEEVDGYIPSRNHKANDISAIVEFAHQFFETAAIWYSRTGVICLTDDNDREDRVSYALSYSPQLSHIQGWAAGIGNRLKQRDAILLLRTMFKNCLGRTGRFLENLRLLNFKTSSEGSSGIQHGKASVGKAIMSEVSGIEAIPESIVMDVPIFASGFKVNLPIEIAIELDPANETIGFIPIPGDIESAIALAEAEVGARIRKELGEVKVPVYYGTP